MRESAAQGVGEGARLQGQVGLERSPEGIDSKGNGKLQS